MPKPKCRLLAGNTCVYMAYVLYTNTFKQSNQKFQFQFELRLWQLFFYRGKTRAAIRSNENLFALVRGIWDITLVKYENTLSSAFLLFPIHFHSKYPK